MYPRAAPRLFAAVAMFCVALGPAAPASAGHAKIVWTITLPASEESEELEKFVRQVVLRESRRADWGKSADGPLEVKLEITELSTVVSGGIVRVTCAGVGRLAGGGPAKSRFSMGARANQKIALQHQLLTMLGRGIVTRLAQMAKAQPAKP